MVGIVYGKPEMNPGGIRGRQFSSSSPVFEGPELRSYGKFGCAMGLDPANDTCLNPKVLRNTDYGWGERFLQVQFHAMPAIENLVHFLPVGSRFFLYYTEQWREGKEIILNNMQPLNKVKDLGLGTTAAMDGTVYFQG